jgi:hypothetical protein
MSSLVGWKRRLLRRHTCEPFKERTFSMLLPNEDFGTSKNKLVMYFVSTFHHFYPNLGVWKVLTKGLTHIFFDVPKSSFGRSIHLYKTNLRLGAIHLYKKNRMVRKRMLPKRRFWKAEQTFQNAFSKHFSTFCIPNPVLTPLKSASKTRSDMFVRPSKSSFGRGKTKIWQGVFSLRDAAMSACL